VRANVYHFVAKFLREGNQRLFERISGVIGSKSYFHSIPKTGAFPATAMPQVPWKGASLLRQTAASGPPQSR
jgi:hypothetical protein